MQKTSSDALRRMLSLHCCADPGELRRRGNKPLRAGNSKPVSELMTAATSLLPLPSIVRSPARLSLGFAFSSAAAHLSFDWAAVMVRGVGQEATR